MRPIHCLDLLLVIALAFAMTLSGCVSRGSTSARIPNTPEPGIVSETPTPVATPTRLPTRTETRPPSATATPPVATHTPRPSPSATPTPPATLEPEQAEQAIRTLLREPVDCLAPCFWQITPGKTTFDEATQIFTHLGLQSYTTPYDNIADFETAQDLSNGISIGVNLTIQDQGVVKNISVGINPEKYQAGVPRAWLAYSPETLIDRYGLPSKVDFFVYYPGELVADFYANYSIIMYFAAVDLIVEYYGKIAPPESSLRICPLTDRFQAVSLWLGKDPLYPPFADVPLEEATEMTMEEFAEMMTGDPENACFKLKGELFP